MRALIAANLPEALDVKLQRQAGWLGERAGYPSIFFWFPIGLALLIALAFFALNLWASSGGSRDYDEGVYWQALRSLAAGHALFREIFAPQGPVFFYGLLPVFSAFGHSIEAARLGVALASMVAALAVFIAAWLTAGRWAGLIAAGLLLTDPIWAVEAQTLHAEIPALAWGLISLALALAARRTRTGQRRLLLAAACGASLALGMATKAFVIVLIPPIALYLAEPLERRSVRRLLPAALAFGLIGLLVFLPFASDATTVSSDLVGLRLAAGHALGKGIGYNFALLHLGRELPLELLALGLLLLSAFRRDRALVPGLIWLIATVLSLLLYQPLFPHELALLVPPLVFIVAVAGGRLLSLAPTGKGWRRLATAGAVGAATFLIAAAATGRDVQATAVASRPVAHENALAAALNAVAAHHELVIGDNPYAIALADRDVPPQLVDTSFARVLSGFLTAEQIQEIASRQGVRVFLFDTGRLDSAPGLKTWVARNYTNTIPIDGGGVLYAIPR